MGFLRRLFGGSGQEQRVQMTFTTFDQQRPDAELEIVGENSYQDALELVGGGRGTDGPMQKAQQAGDHQELRGDVLRVERRELSVGGLVGDRVAVLAGLEPGQRVVSRGWDHVTVGDSVTIVGEGP